MGAATFVSRSLSTLQQKKPFSRATPTDVTLAHLMHHNPESQGTAAADAFADKSNRIHPYTSKSEAKPRRSPAECTEEEGDLRGLPTVCEKADFMRTSSRICSCSACCSTLPSAGRLKERYCQYGDCSCYTRLHLLWKWWQKAAGRLSGGKYSASNLLFSLSSLTSNITKKPSLDSQCVPTTQPSQHPLS